MGRHRGSDSRHDAEILKQADRHKTGDKATKADAAAKIRAEVAKANDEHPPTGGRKAK